MRDPGMLPPSTALGHVHLTVADLPAMLAFYRDILRLRVAFEFSDSTILLSADGRYPYQVALTKSPGASVPARRSAGLYHFALLLPSRAGLAGIFRRLLDAGWPIDGASDHKVSEAVYLRDPEGNGMELYADRPRAQWEYHNGDLQMTTEPLDVDELLTQAGEAAWTGFPAGSQLGHIHLRVSDLRRAEAFYSGLLGFAVVVRTYPGAVFLAAGGYHHHLGLNIWAGTNVARSVPGARGLRTFTIRLPDTDALRDVLQRLRNTKYPIETALDHGVSQAIYLQDPDGIGVALAIDVPREVPAWMEQPLDVTTWAG